MDWPDWRPTYEAILADFGWDTEADAAAATHLDRLLPKGGWRNVATELRRRPSAVVVGCSEALDTLAASDFPSGVVVAADGATARLQELGITPRVVVTDLDGDPHALRWAAAQGSSIVVHAHGDNQRLLSAVDALGPFVAGSCQSDPAGLERVRNHGGFTDGDRAVLLCEAMAVRNIHLLAFDTHGPPSRHTGHSDPALKPRKLDWARRIIAEAQGRGTQIYGTF